MGKSIKDAQNFPVRVEGNGVLAELACGFPRTKRATLGT